MAPRGEVAAAVACGVAGAGSEAVITPIDPIVRRFVVGGKLSVIPARRAKRRRVLDWLVQEFEPGRVYPEAAVNSILGRYYPDYAALRRCLVDEDFMERRHGFYWRSGGTYEV